MCMIIKACGDLLKWMEDQNNIARRKQKEDKQIYANIIDEYQRQLLSLEFTCKTKDWEKYLVVRRARYAVEKGMEKFIPVDILYAWMVQNICDLEDVR